MSAQRDADFYIHADQLIYFNNYDSAEIILRNKLAEDKVDNDTYFYAHLYLSKMYMKLGALNKWNKEINFCKEITNNKSGEIYKLDLIYELGNAYFSLQQFDSAYYYCTKYVNSKKDISGEKLSKIELIFGYYYFINKKYEEAEKCYLKAENHFYQENLQCELPLVYCKLALLKGKQRKLSEAQKYVSKSLAFADSCDIISYKLFSLQAKRDILLLEEKYEEAFYTLYKINDINTIIYEQKTNTKLIEIREKYKAKEQEKKLSMAVKDNLINKNKLTLVISVMILLVLILILLLYIYQKNKRANEFIQEQSKKLTIQNNLIKDSLEQREFLYRELNHRIKNNLQLITSMLNMQNMYSHYKSFKDLIFEINQKINTIALTYAKMYMDGRKTNDIINLNEYITEIAQNVLQSISQKDINIDIHVEPVSTNLDIAIPLGLITNEVITNSVKHAFSQNDNPLITIYLSQHEDDILFSIEDNGSGISSDFSLETSNRLGSKIILLLSKQIKSKLELQIENGTKYIFTVKNLKKQNYESNNM